MVKMEYISPEGFRLDGRRSDEIRHLSCHVGGVSNKADGSASVSMGETKVIAYVYGPFESTSKRSTSIQCEWHMAPFSTSDHRRRKRTDRGAVETALALRETLHSVIITERYPRSEIKIFVHVLEADGGARAAGFNASILALIDAGVALFNVMSSCTASIINDEAIIDLNQTEVNAGGPELTMAAICSTKKVVFLGLDSKLDSVTFRRLYESGLRGCSEVEASMKNAIRESATGMLLRSESLLQQRLRS